MADILQFLTREQRTQQKVINEHWAELLRRASNWEFSDLEIAEHELHQPTEEDHAD